MFWTEHFEMFEHSEFRRTVPRDASGTEIVTIAGGKSLFNICERLV